MRTLSVALLLVVAACESPPALFELPSYGAAQQVGPSEATNFRPAIFLAGQVPEEALAELAPFCGTRVSYRPGRDSYGAQTATQRLMRVRPDAVLLSASDPRVSGVSNYYFANPFAPGVISFAAAEVTVPAVAYAMRALPVSLPFRYSPTTGMVLDVLAKDAVTGGLLEGDTLTKIDVAPAIPPKDWPNWIYYARMLQQKPGDEVALEWIRPGVGKMSGVLRLQPPAAPHLHTPDSIDTSRMPEVLVIERENGTVEWNFSGLSFESWEQNEAWRKPRHEARSGP